MNQPLNEYLRNKDKQEQTRFVIKNGVGEYVAPLYNIPKQSFENWFPLGDKVTLFSHYEKGSNPDKKRVV